MSNPHELIFDKGYRINSLGNLLFSDELGEEKSSRRKLEKPNT